MNFSDYENKLPSPNKADFTTTYYYEHGQCVFQVGPGEEVPENLHGFVRERCFDSAAYRSKLRERDQESMELMDRFKADLLDDLGIVDNPKAELLFNIAWEYGDHECEAVYEHAVGMVELIK